MELKQKLKQFFVKKTRACLPPASSVDKARQGSVLIYSIVILGMMLTIVIGMTSVSISDLRNSSATGKSTQAFQTANSGSELILKSMKIAVTVDDLSIPGFSCSATTNNLEGSISGAQSSIGFYDSTGAQIDCDSTALVATVDKIKSTGTWGGSSRAIEVAVASGTNPGITGGCLVNAAVPATKRVMSGWGDGCLPDTSLVIAASPTEYCRGAVVNSSYECGFTGILREGDSAYLCMCTKV